MISSLKGIVQMQKNDTLIIKMAGFGFQVTVPESVMVLVGSEIELHTYMNWNQESGPSLFGFLDMPQRELFCLLISVSGIGPRMALALLSAFSVTVLMEALISGNSTLLSSVSGIGRKKAELLILSLKDKVQKIDLYTSSFDAKSGGSFGENMRDLTDALTSLGYSRQEILLVADQLRNIDDAWQLPFDKLLRKSLQLLSKI